MPCHDYKRHNSNDIIREKPQQDEPTKDFLGFICLEFQILRLISADTRSTTGATQLNWCAVRRVTHNSFSSKLNRELNKRRIQCSSP